MHKKQLFPIKKERCSSFLRPLSPFYTQIHLIGMTLAHRLHDEQQAE